ncbi:MAG: potassium channel protein [Acidobacteria bacterium]|nr:MAG: potassium channel protein [Acidobacteriota bacterium]REK11242.1 MAG: potassium channel protein [Acidobacteriota bacterium]
MKILAGEIATILATRGGQRPRMGVLIRFLAILVAMVSFYALVFKVLMAQEGQEQSWVTSFYWVLTVMSTLGFGDITFHTDTGRLFSIVVLLSGMLFLLVLLPFIFIEFFYQPWMKAQTAARTPRSLKPGTRGHVVITHLDAVAAAFIRRLESYGHEYCLLVSDTDEGLRLLDHGYEVVVGRTDDPETYRLVRAEDAALIAATGSDPANTLIASTVREVSKRVPIIATADDAASIDILALADCEQVLHLSSLMGAALARRVVGGSHHAHVIGNFDQLLIAEASTDGTELAGKTVKECGVRARTGLGIVGVWERGAFEPVDADLLLTDHTVLLLAGTKQQIETYNRVFGDSTQPHGKVLILGGGRVGRTVARSLGLRGIDYRVVEKNPTRPEQDERWVLGNAAELRVLQEAGIDEATTVIITPHDDELNVYLTLYCRKLHPTAQILCRATDQRTVNSIHRAGADFVLSYASMGSTLLFNALDITSVMIVAEGLVLFRLQVPPSLVGRKILDSGIRERTGATVAAVEDAGGVRTINPPPDTELTAGGRVVLIGAFDCEQRFVESFGS